MIGVAQTWDMIGLVSAIGCAAACSVAAIWLTRRPLAWRRERITGLAALCLTALWAGVLAALGPQSLATAAAEAVRNLSWLALLHALSTLQ